MAGCTTNGGIKMAKYRKLGRTSSQRKALLRNQVTALLNNGKIVTTEAKAKEIRKVAEGLIALASVVTILPLFNNAVTWFLIKAFL